MHYTIRKISKLPEVTAEWGSDAWSTADTISIPADHYWKSKHIHIPKTQARMLHNGETIAVMFRIEDQYIIARGTHYQDRTHKDSCAEFFIEPVAGKGYLNFEFNCGGVLLLTYIEDATRTQDGFKKYTHIPAQVIANMQVHTTLTTPIDPEITEPTTWTLSYTIPKIIFETYVGTLPTLNGLTMRGNVYKCADESSHPHWGYWADIGEELNFHQPGKFAPIHLEG